MHGIILADAGLADIDALIGRHAPDVTVIRVAGDEDALGLLADALEAGPAAVHLIAHGAPGVVRLGAMPLDISALLDRRWPDASGTEILIHACDVGAGADGRSFVECLAAVTGARVAAASHPVGHADQGGSWELDVVTGQILTARPFAGADVWPHRLAYSGTPSAGNDTLVGDNGGNVINGLAGNDSIVGGTGNDSLIGGLGDDTLVGGGNSGVAAGDTMNGGLGADHYVGGGGFNIVTYEDATTGITLDLGNGANNTGEAAGDTFENIQRWIGSEYADSMTAGDTAVWFWGHGGDDIEHGGAGNDTLEAGDGNDSVFGGGGNDLIYGRADNDELHGQDGNDTVAGGGGADLIHGDAGNDLLKGDWERDTIHGGDGDDTILAGIVTAGSYAQTQADTIFGEAGNDRYIVVSQYDAGTVSFDGGTGTDTLEVRSDNLTSYNGYDLEYYTAVASPTIDLTGMTLASVERLELTGSQDHTVTLTGAQAAGFEAIVGSAATDTLRIAGSADLSVVALSGIETIAVIGSGATLRLAASQLAGLALTGTAGSDDLTVGAGTTVTGNGGDDIIRIAAGTTGAVTVTDAAIGDRLVMEGADLAGMRVETAAGSTVLRVGDGLAVTLTGSFDASQFQAGNGGVTIVQAASPPPPSPPAPPPPPTPSPDSTPIPTPVPPAGPSPPPQASSPGGLPAGFNGLAYIASYPDLIAAFGANAEAAARHYIEFGRAEGRIPNFNGLAYIASHPDLIAAFGTNADAGTRHFIENGYAEGRSVTFDGYNYLAANRDVALAFGADPDAAARHYIQNGISEGRPAQGFDALRYIASNPDLIQAFGPDVQAAELHYIQIGYAEGRSLTAFDPAAYLASNPDIAAEFGTSDAAILLAYIKRSTSTETAAMPSAAMPFAAMAGAPIAVTMLAAEMTGSEALGIGSGFHDPAFSGTALGMLAAGDGGLSGRERMELPA